MGRVFGVPVDVHWTFLLVPPAILYFSHHPERGLVTAALTWYALVTVLLFLFVLVHELGHALVARNRKVEAERILLFPLGGGAYLPARPEKVLDEVLIYAAGPVANLVLAALALPVLLRLPDGEFILRSFVEPAGNFVVNPERSHQLLGVTVAVNVILALGNLLPAYPLDGGRILRALLRKPFGKRRATVVVTVLGVLIGLGLIGLAYLLNDWLLALGATFIIGMSGLAYRDGWQRRRLAKYTVAPLVRPVADLVLAARLYPNSPVSSAQQLFAELEWPVLPVYDEWNELLGFVAAEVIEEEDPEGRGLIREVAELEYTTARARDNLLAATEKIVAANVYGAAVYGPGRRLEGFLFTEDVMRVLGK